MDNKKLITKLTQIQRLFDGPNYKQPPDQKNTTQEAEEILDYIRVCAKYTLLDLEATKRRNNYLENILKREE